MIQGIFLQGVGLLQLLAAIELSRVESPALLRHIHTEQGQDVRGRLGEAGQDIDRLGGEVTSLLCSLAKPDTPAAVLHCFPRVRLV